MASGAVRLACGDARSYSIADVGVRFRSELSGRFLVLPWSFARFEAPRVPADVDVVVRRTMHLGPVGGEPVSDSHSHWRSWRTRCGLVFELFHPRTASVYCRMSVDPGFTRADIVFAEGPWLALGADRRQWLIPHPLDQLLLAPALALRGACLLHACGASLGGRADVFAGHSGDGKTTLARLLKEERFEVLSDERIALRVDGDGVFAYGTPWPGEGEIASPDRHRLRGIFVLRKAERHFVGTPEIGLASELVARTILPFYLPQVATRILALLDGVLSRVPVRELRFGRSPGLRELLCGVA